MRPILFAVCVLASACVGQLGNTTPDDDDDGPGPAGAAREIYINDVHPVMARCTGIACHATDATASAAIGKFYTADPGAGYTAITAAISIVGQYNEIAPILTKIDAGHQGITYSGGERSSILAWLAAEAEERADSGQPPPVDPVALLNTFSSCMTIEQFDLAGMAEAWGGLGASNGQACVNCHQAGAFGFTVSLDSQLFFGIISSSLSQNLKYFSVANGKVVINMGALTNAGTAIPDHPPFDPVNNAGMPALQAFYNAVDAATIQAGPAGCGAPKIVGP
jgi:hypothetical protein